MTEPADCRVKIKNHPGGSKAFPASEIVSVDALALVRFGLRAADDPRITNMTQGNRRHFENRDADRPGVAPLYPRWLRRNGERRPL